MQTSRPSPLAIKLARQWHRHGPPLRPSPADARAYEQAVHDWRRRVGAGQVRALLLGATPEIAAMRWPEGTTLVALDYSLPMLQIVYPARETPYGVRVCGEWRRMPLPDGSCDVVIGDGCFVALDFPAGHAALTRAFRAALRKDGLLVLRFFCRPDAPESVEAVFTDALGGRIGSFHAFKWRLAMALHGATESGVRVGAIWDMWQSMAGTSQAFAARTGWSQEVVETIEAYRGLDRVYTFPTLAESKAALEAHFELLDCRTLDYELGERCPILTARPR
jgi:SAM-dependent methyltransferase